MKVAGNSEVAHAAHTYRSETSSKKLEVAAKPDGSTAEVSDSKSLEQDSSEKQKGVIRNLLDGHFKGVADVRLRINFYDELAALEEGVKMSSFQNNLPDFRSSLDDAFSSLLENQDLDQQQLEQISEEKKSLDLKLDDLLGQELSSTELFNAVQSETNTFLEAINSILEPASNEVAEEDTSVEQSTQTTEDPLSDFKNQLTEAFGLLETKSLSTQVLPELSEPSGNGVAYEKFLSIYQGLQNGEGMAAAEQEQSTVNTEA